MYIEPLQSFLGREVRRRGSKGCTSSFRRPAPPAEQEIPPSPSLISAPPSCISVHLAERRAKCFASRRRERDASYPPERFPAKEVGANPGAPHKTLLRKPRSPSPRLCALLNYRGLLGADGSEALPTSLFLHGGFALHTLHSSRNFLVFFLIPLTTRRPTTQGKPSVAYAVIRRVHGVLGRLLRGGVEIPLTAVMFDQLQSPKKELRPRAVAHDNLNNFLSSSSVRLVHVHPEAAEVQLPSTAPVLVVLVVPSSLTRIASTSERFETGRAASLPGHLPGPRLQSSSNHGTGRLPITSLIARTHRGLANPPAWSRPL